MTLLSGGVITVGLGIWERYEGAVPAGTYGIVIGICLFFAAFLAWRKEFVENRDGPDVILEWHSGSQPWEEETISFRNVGKRTALNIQLGQFSWPNVMWNQPVEIQSLDPNREESVKPLYRRELVPAYGVSVGHMWSLLEHPNPSNTEPLTINATFRDSKNCTFTRTFKLRLSTGPGRKVFVDLGQLVTKHSST